MHKLTKRYLISGAIGITSMLVALGVVLFKASDKVRRADAAVKPLLSSEASKPAPGHKK